MYLQLMNQANLECVERNKAVHAPLNLKLAQKHFQERLQELSEEITAEESKFQALFSEIQEIQSGRWDERIQPAPESQPSPPSVEQAQLQLETQERVQTERQEPNQVSVGLHNDLAPAATPSLEELTPTQTEGQKTNLPTNEEVFDGSDLSGVTDAGSFVDQSPNDGLLEGVSKQGDTMPEADEGPLKEKEEVADTRSRSSSPTPMGVDRAQTEVHLSNTAQEPQDAPSPSPSDIDVSATPKVIQDMLLVETIRVQSKEGTPLIESANPASIKEEGHEAIIQETEEIVERPQSRELDVVKEKEVGEDDDEVSNEEPPRVTRRTTRASAAASKKSKARRTKESAAHVEMSPAVEVTAVVEEPEPLMKLEEADQMPSPTAQQENARKREGKRKASFIDGVESPRDRKRARDDSEPADDFEPGPAVTAPRGRRRDRTEEQMALRRFQNVITMLHSQISQHRNGNIFHNPIKNSEAPDYHEIVKRPMDLKTIKTRVKDGVIVNSLEYQRDIFLMFANAMMYNRPGSGVYVMAEDMMLESEGYINSFRQTEGLVQRAQRM
ncbi:hypothetical protein AX16_003135 [Volvariella volvacea WC 439]|nr:hypothetical protein AX16_003135 [Volvariella volvacea WC 439]